MSTPKSFQALERGEGKKAAAALAAVLTRQGLRAGPREPVPGKGDDERPFGQRLGTALTELGSSFGVAFPLLGSYLSRRPDLLAVTDCLALREIPPVAQATAATLDEVFADLGGPRELFSAVSPRPRHRGPLRLQYQALLGERPVLVEVVPETLQEELQRSLPYLALLQPSWSGFPLAATFPSVVDDFQSWVSHQLDPGSALADLEAFGEDPVGSRRLALPRPYAYLCGPRRLVLDDPQGIPLGQPGGAEQTGDGCRRALARRITLAWLVQALVTRSFVAEMAEDDLLTLPRQGLALRSGGPLHRTPEESQSHWWSYLQAALAEDPDACCTWLLRECTATGSEADADELHLRLRQIVPFRDGAWTEEGDTLAEKLFLHWRIARDCGFRLRPAALTVAQGLFATAAVGRSLDPQGDPLRDSLQDLRWMTGWSQMRQWANLPHMARLLERNAEALMELPAKVDRLLSSEPGPAAPAPEPARSSARWEGPATALLSLIAGTLLTDHLADGGLFGQAGDAVTASIFLVLGALLLRAIWRNS